MTVWVCEARFWGARWAGSQSSPPGNTRPTGTSSPSLRLSRSILFRRRLDSDGILKEGDAEGREAADSGRAGMSVKDGGGDAGEAGIVSRAGFTEAWVEGGAFAGALSASLSIGGRRLGW